MFTNAVLTDDIFRDICKQCDIFVLLGETLELVRRKCCNKPVIERFYSLITDLVINYEPAYKFNVDETGLVSKRVFKILTEDRRFRITIQSNQLPHISCMLCFSEAGAKMNPFFIFPKHVKEFRELIDIPDIFYSTSQNGWMTSHLWSIWCILFISFISTKRDARQLKREKPVILFVDGHLSRLDPFRLRLLKQNNIICIIFPSHCSHVLQPFDVGVGSKLKTFYIQEAISKLISHFQSAGDLSNTEIVRRQRVLAFQNAWNRISVPLMRGSFKAAGLGFESFGVDFMVHKNLIVDPTIHTDGENPINMIRMSPINGKIATENLELLEPYVIGKQINGRFVTLHVEPGEFTPEMISIEWFRTDANIGKIFNNIVPIYEQGRNIMYQFSRSGQE